jgi:hypothetical protein
LATGNKGEILDWITEQVAIGDYREAQDAALLRHAGGWA